MQMTIGSLAGMFNISNWRLGGADIGVILGYLVLMIIVGMICRKSSNNISDYIRMGCKSTWWLMGMSIFMQAISASTFTGGGAQAYLSGWSVLLVGAGGVFGLLTQAIWFAPLMRRTRAVTPGDAVRMRFGPVAEQVFVYIGAFGGMMWGGTMLFGLATFVSPLFNVPMPTVILFVGVIIVFYSVSGGSWSVQITDTLQSFVMIPICLVVTYLALHAVGGIDGLLESIQARPELAADYKMIMEEGHVYSASTDVGSVGRGLFTVPWIIASFLYSFVISANMTSCHRYLSTKSDGAARKAAVFAAILLFIGGFIWYIPGMVGRVKYEGEINALATSIKVEKMADKVEAELTEMLGESWRERALTEGERATLTATLSKGLKDGDARWYDVLGLSAYPEFTAEQLGANWPERLGVTITAIAAAGPDGVAGELPPPSMARLNNAGDGAYAIVAKNVLPPGLLGLMVVAMFAAAMSSMDSSLTGTAGLITKNLYPPLARLVRRKPLEGKPLMRMTQAVNLMLGGWAILISYLFYIWGGSASIYEIGLKIVVLVSAPMVMAFALSFFIPWLPRWGPLVGMAFGFVASAIFMFTKDVAGWYPDWVWLQSFAADVRSLQWHQQMYISTGVVLGSTALTALFWKYEPKEYAERVDKFFTNLRTPVNFDQEVGESQDGSLLRMIGILGLCMAAAIGILFFLAEDHAGRMSVLFIVLSIGLVSAFMTWRGYRSHPGDGIAALGAGVSPADGDEKEAVMAADETDEQR